MHGSESCVSGHGAGFGALTWTSVNTLPNYDNKLNLKSHLEKNKYVCGWGRECSVTLASPGTRPGGETQAQSSPGPSAPVPWVVVVVAVSSCWCCRACVMAHMSERADITSEQDFC